MSALLAAYRIAAGALEPAAPLLLRARARRGKEEPARLPERLGREAGERPPGRLVHLHGASVGETLSLLPLVEALAAAAPDATLLTTSGTVTSATLLGQRLPRRAIHRYAPVDAPGATARWVRRWRPDLSVFVESEVWPNWLGALRSAGARTALVSARLSERSLRGWERIPASARAVFGDFDLTAAQDDPTAARLARLGAGDDGRINLKLAGGPLPVEGEALARARAEAEGARVLTAASTHPGEEETVLDAFARLARPDRLLVLVPRHPERGPAMLALARARGLGATLRSEGGGLLPGGVHVADTLGELGLWFALAAEGGSALVAGSLVPGVGGHNPLEAVRAGAPVLRGRFVENWAPLYAELGVAAPVVADAGALAAAWAADLGDPEAAARRADRARAPLAGADLTDLTRRLVGLLPPP